MCTFVSFQFKNKFFLYYVLDMIKSILQANSSNCFFLIKLQRKEKKLF